MSKSEIVRPELAFVSPRPNRARTGTGRRGAVGGAMLKAALAAAFPLLSATAFGQTYVPLQNGGNPNTQVTAVSADGMYALGWQNTLTGPVVVRWDSQGNRQELCQGIAKAINADGSVVVGYGDTGAFVWTASGGYQLLPAFDSTSYAGSVSGSGTTIFGQVHLTSGTGWPHAVTRWDLVNGQYVATLFNNVDSFTLAPLDTVTPDIMSADGSTFVGRCGTQQGFRNWSCFFGGVVQRYMEGGIPRAISADGSTVIVGDNNAMRYLRGQNVLQPLGAVPGYPSNGPTACNADASLVVGWSSGAPVRAFLWTEAIGMVDLSNYLTAIGVPQEVSPSQQNSVAYGVSADGRVIVGITYPGIFAWMVRLPCAPQPLPQVTPTAASSCPSGSTTFSAAAAGSGPFTYQWQAQTSPGVWRTMGNDPFPLPCGGGAFAYATPINSPTVTIGIRPCPGNVTAPQHFQIRALVTNSCGTATSNEATYTICPADFNCTGAISVQDIFDFLATYFAADPRADFNASDTISVQDIFDFLAAYFAGCG